MIKALLAILLSILSIPIIGVIMLFDFAPNIPVDTYVYVPTSTLLAEQVQANVSSIQLGELEIQLEEEFINQFLYSTFVEQVNPSYNPGPECSEDSCEYLLINEAEGNTVALTGIWVRLFDDVISVNVGLRSLNIPFQTKVRLDFSVTDNADVFEIEYSRLQLGNIPLPAFIIRPIVNLLIEQTNINSSFSEGGFLLDLEQLSLKIDKQGFIESSLEPEVALFASLIVEEELIRFMVDGDSSRLVLFVDVDKLYSNLEVKSYSGNQEAVFTNLLMEVFGNLDFNFIEGFTLSNNDYYISEDGLNEIITAQFADLGLDGLIDSEFAGLLFGFEPLWIELEGSNATLVVPLKFMGNLVPVELHMSAIPSNSDLVLEVERITIGRDAQKSVNQYITIEGERVEALLSQVSLGSPFIFEPGNRIFRVPVRVFDEAIRELTSELRVNRVAIEDGQLLLELDLA
jgi:hypothetical protein